MIAGRWTDGRRTNFRHSASRPGDSPPRPEKIWGQRFCRYCGSSLQRADQESIPTQTLGSNGSPSEFSVALGEESCGDRPVASWRWDIGTKSRRRWLVVVVVGPGMILGGWTVGWIIRQGIAARFPFQQSAPAVEVGRPSIGVHFEDEQDAPSGAFIDGVVAGSPADRAGLIGGDTIVQANGRPIRDARDFRRVLRSQGPGSLLIPSSVTGSGAKQSSLWVKPE